MHAPSAGSGMVIASGRQAALDALPQLLPDSEQRAGDGRTRLAVALGQFVERQAVDMMPFQKATGVIAQFGQWRLVQTRRLRLELRVGSTDDEIAARSWVALFMPEAVLGRRAGPAGAGRLAA